MAKTPDPNLSRRRFLQATGGSIVAAPLAGALTPAAAQVPDIRLPDVPGQKVGWAVVGLGKLTINQILPAFAKCEQSKLVALRQRPPGQGAQARRRATASPTKNIYNYENYDKIADNPDIEVVYVVLPNSMHAEYTIRALKAGKHVLCEKPMANTAADCEQMIAAARQAGKLMVAYRLRYEPYNQALIEVRRASKELGPAEA